MADKKREKTKFEGVYVRLHKTRLHRGKPDRVFEIMYRDADGRKRLETIGALSEGYSAQHAANTRANRLRQVRRREPLPIDEQVTFDQAFERYLDWAKANKDTWETDKWRYEKHIKPVLGSISIQLINASHIEKIKANQKEAGAAAATIKHSLAIVRQVFNLARAWKLTMRDNPVKSVKIPQVRNQRFRFFSEQEVARLLEECRIESQQLYNLVATALYTGMRFGECAALRWGYIDYDNRVIRIPADCRRAKKRAGKPISLGQQAEMILRAVPKRPECSFVFPNAAGNQMDRVPEAYFRVLNRLALNEGLPPRDPNRLDFHSLRHTFASWLVLKGVPLVTVKELMGHSSYEMTLRYAHLVPDVKQQAVDLLGTDRSYELGYSQYISEDNPSDSEPVLH